MLHGNGRLKTESGVLLPTKYNAFSYISRSISSLVVYCYEVFSMRAEHFSIPAIFIFIAQSPIARR